MKENLVSSEEKKKPQKNVFKFWIDSLLFVNMLSVVMVGVLLAFVIPSGRSYAGKYFLGLHRHEWANIHLYLSIFLVVLLCFHVWMNLTWIVQSTRRYFGERWKQFLGVLSGAWIVVIFICWCFAMF